MATAEEARLALDEDVRPLLVRLLTDRGWDAVSVVNVGRRGMQDEEQLVWATNAGRVLVTHNAADFAALAIEWDVLAARMLVSALLAKVRSGGSHGNCSKCSRCGGRRDWTDQVVWAGSATRRR